MIVLIERCDMEQIVIFLVDEGELAFSFKEKLRAINVLSTTSH